MSGFAPARFEKRRIQEWLEMAESGQLALPSFQRSYVWKNKQSVADYLSAVFRNRPTGIFLVLKTNGKPQFPVRTIRGVEADPGQARSLSWMDSSV